MRDRPRFFFEPGCAGASGVVGRYRSGVANEGSRRDHKKRRFQS